MPVRAGLALSEVLIRSCTCYCVSPWEEGIILAANAVRIIWLHLSSDISWDDGPERPDTAVFICLRISSEEIVFGILCSISVFNKLSSFRRF